MKKIVINGAHFSKTTKLTGIQRVGREVILALDKQLTDEKDVAVEYAYFEDGENVMLNPAELQNIRPVPFKSHKKFATSIFQLFTLPRYLKKEKALGINVSFEYIRYKNTVSSIFDLRPMLFSSLDKKKPRLMFKLMVKLICRYSKKIVTDSAYQKQDICRHLKRKEEDVEVVYCGWEHMQQIDSSKGVLPDVQKGEYYYTVGSLAPHKNFEWIIQVAKRNPAQTFVIAGAKDINAWGDLYKDVRLDNVKFVGYVTDEMNKYLMENCKAFVFPSKYEGFGIPPLEALSVGAKVICSNATCLPEVFEDSVSYFDPNDYEVDLDELVNQEVAPAKKILEKCSWESAAEKWWTLIQEEASK